MRNRKGYFPLRRFLLELLPAALLSCGIAAAFAIFTGDAEPAAKLDHLYKYQVDNRHSTKKERIGSSVRLIDNDAQHQHQQEVNQRQQCQGSTAETVMKAWSSENLKETRTCWELAEQETIALRELGQRLQDVHYHKNEPFFVVRFLLQRQGDVDAAERMFRKSVQWRLDNKVDSILKDYKPPQFLLDHYPSGTVMQGLDREGDPILVTRHGSADLTGLLERFGWEAMLRYAIWNREMVMHGDWVQKYEKISGHRFTRFVNVEDSQGLKLFKTVFNRRSIFCVSQISQIDKNNYPQTVKKSYVVGVPGIFETIWNVLRRMMDPEVVKRVAILSPKNYLKDLEAALDPSLLPDEIVPGIGKGKAWEGFPSFHVGPVSQK